MRIFNDRHEKAEEYFRHICKEIEENTGNGDTRQVYKRRIEITGSFSTKMCGVKDKEGKVLTVGEQVKARWKEYTEELYKRDPAMTEKFEEHRYDIEPLILQREV